MFNAAMTRIREES